LPRAAVEPVFLAGRAAAAGCFLPGAPLPDFLPGLLLLAFLLLVFFPLAFLRLADFLADGFAAFLRAAVFPAAFLLTFFVAFFLPDVFLDADFFTDFFADFLDVAGFFRATDFFLEAFLVEDFLPLTLRFLLAAFLLAVDFRDAVVFLPVPARLRFLLAAFFAGMFHSCRSEKNAELYIGCTNMEACLHGFSPH
jgi:hypothetical protein